MSQPFDCQTQVPALRPVDTAAGEFWVSNPWMFSKSGENLSSYERNGLFINGRDGSFHNLSFLSGADSEGDGRSAFVWDITGDGMPELIVRQAGGGVLLVFENKLPQVNWLKIALRGDKSNSAGIGAKISLELEDQTLRQELYPISSFLAQSPALAHFGLGQANAIKRLTVRWPSGHEQSFDDIDINRFVVISEANDELSYLDND